jgi:hypothetical protein
MTGMKPRPGYFSRTDPLRTKVVQVKTGDASPPALTNDNIKSIVKEYLAGNPKLYKRIGLWDVSNVTNMEYLFFKQNAFNEHLEWSLRDGIITISDMFYGCSSYNQPLEMFDGRDVKGCPFGSFAPCEDFDQDISKWKIMRGIQDSILYWRRQGRSYTEAKMKEGLRDTYLKGAPKLCLYQLPKDLQIKQEQDNNELSEEDLKRMDACEKKGNNQTGGSRKRRRRSRSIMKWQKQR